MYCFENAMENRNRTIKRLRIRELLRPHVAALIVGFVAVVGEGVANLLEPWPLKIVLDSVLRSHPLNGWLNHSAIRDRAFSMPEKVCDKVSNHGSTHIRHCTCGDWSAKYSGDDLRRQLAQHALTSRRTLTRDFKSNLEYSSNPIVRVASQATEVPSWIKKTL